MLCYETQINGKKACLAGHEKMEGIQFSIYYGTRMPHPHLSIIARVRTSDSLAQDAQWEPPHLKLGDEVLVRLIDCDNPDPPSKYVSFGSKLHPMEEAELFCSFCGRSQNEVKKLIRGAAANACDECIKMLNEMLEAK